MDTCDLSEDDPWATNVHTTYRVGSASVSALISSRVLGYTLGESSSMVSGSTRKISSASSKLHWNASSLGSEGVGRFKAALDSVSAKYLYLPFF